MADYTITQTDMDNLNAADVGLTINGQAAIVGSQLNGGTYGDILRATATNNKIFTTQSSTPNVGMNLLGQGGGGGSVYLVFQLYEPNFAGATMKSDANYYQLNVSTETAFVDYFYTLTETDISTVSAANALLTINEVSAVVGDEIRAGDALKVVTNEGFAFLPSAAPVEVDASVYLSGQNPISGEMVYQSFVLNVDFNEANLIFDSGNQEKLIVFSGLTVVTEQTDSTAGTNNVYLINSNLLASVNAERFVPSSVDGVYDYGQFILSVLELPFSIPENQILQDEKIRLASLQTTIDAPKLSTDKIIIDLGEIKVLPVDNNLLDFKDTTALLHLPRMESILIEIDYVINETISIEYIVDCYTGIATVNISSTKIDGVIITNQVDLGVTIPYSVLGNSATLENDGVKIGGDNGVTVPYIELIKNEAILPNGFFTIPIIDESVLISQNGFIKIEEINLVSLANSADKKAIESILKSGVIIK